MGVTLVFGVSLKEDRYSNIVVKRLLQHNISTRAFGIRSGLVGTVNIDTQLISYTNLDTITLYVNPERQKMYYDYLLGLKPRRIIFNPGTENNEFYNLLAQHNIKAEVACTLVLLSTNQY